ncbi:hypothetical protein FA13DRAFT_1723470 [Coprinellus micaceus]|uniref:Uncharacterized protein n=1 Tax=Coprinellus micaceus TaxID=71717 RepID=A0A4Y7R4J7_COPMI|nr:hypothetical protein FA13DRAFT_1723470 [Coprinellus micaceus]
MSSGVQGIEVRKCQLDSFLCEIRKAEATSRWPKPGPDTPLEPCYDDATSTKVPPDELEGHRQEYYFRAPSCLCAYLDDDLAYSECKITLIEPVPENKRDPRRRPFIGEYVAECRTGHVDILQQVNSGQVVYETTSSITIITSESEMRGAAQCSRHNSGAGFHRTHLRVGDSAPRREAEVLSHDPEYVSLNLDDLGTDSEEEKEMDEVLDFMHAAMFRRKSGGRSFAVTVEITNRFYRVRTMYVDSQACTHAPALQLYFRACVDSAQGFGDDSKGSRLCQVLAASQSRRPLNTIWEYHKSPAHSRHPPRRLSNPRSSQLHDVRVIQLRTAGGGGGGVLHDPKFGRANVHETIVVGGSTRIPCISKLVSNFFNGVEPNNDTSEVTRISSSSPRWRTPSLGTASGAVTALIKRIATKKSEIFSTYADNQPGIVISTEHGLERTCTKENHLLSEFELFSYPSALRGVLRSRSPSTSAPTGCQVRRPTITNNISRPSEDEMGFNAEKYKAHHLSNSINDDKLAVKFGARARDKPESAIDEPISWLATPRRIPRASRVLNPTDSRITNIRTAVPLHSSYALKVAEKETEFSVKLCAARNLLLSANLLTPTSRFPARFDELNQDLRIFPAARIRCITKLANILSDNALEKVQVVLFLRDASPSHVSRLLVAPRPPSSSVTPPSPTRNPTMGAIAVSQPIVQSVRKRKRGRARWWFPKPRWNDNPRHERCPSPATAREPLANLPHQRQLEMIMAHNNQDNPSVDFVKFTQSRIPQRPDQPQQHSNQPPFLNPDTNHAPSGNTFSPGMLNDFRRCSPSNPPNSMPGRPPSMAGISQLAQAPDRANQIRMSIRNNENMVNQPKRRTQTITEEGEHPPQQAGGANGGPGSGWNEQGGNDTLFDRNIQRNAAPMQRSQGSPMGSPHGSDFGIPKPRASSTQYKGLSENQQQLTPQQHPGSQRMGPP